MELVRFISQNNKRPALLRASLSQIYWIPEVQGKSERRKVRKTERRGIKMPVKIPPGMTIGPLTTCRPAGKLTFHYPLFTIHFPQLLFKQNLHLYRTVKLRVFLHCIVQVLYNRS